jgi:dienelactone hydrolase
MKFRKILKSIKKPFKKVFQKLKIFFAHIKPSKTATRGAAYGMLAIAALMVILPNLQYFQYMNWLVILVMTIMMLGFGILTGLLFNLSLKLINKIPTFFRFALVVLLFAVMFQIGMSMKTGGVIFMHVFLVSSLAGAAIWVLLRKNWRKFRLSRKIIVTLCGITGVAGLALFTWWLLDHGKEMELPEIAALKGEYRPTHIEAEDPGAQGKYNVLYLTYGSGKDKQRKEFAEDVSIVTDSVDGSFFVDGWKGFAGKMRTKFFGFDLESLPRNAGVWYPEGDGPFPLVLVVHGNHLAQDYSDPGYDYLGELLASRGFILASVDENFFNGSYTNIFGGLKTENDARGWMLLEHLKLWHEWNADTASMFFNKVDTENISLIGHSRGGEAVGHAALFNALPYYPDNAKAKFDYNFKLKSVIAIAPSDGQYQPAGVRTPVKDVSYFVLHGAHDADVQSFAGMKQYQRVTFSEDFKGFKAGLYIFGANHGQFNTSWGRKDYQSPRINIMNLKQLMSREDQEKIAKTYMAAFLEITLKGKEEYLPLFMDYRTGINWLPETIYLNRFDKPGMQYIAQYDEDLDITTTTLAGGFIETENLTVWREQLVKLKWGDKETRAAYLGWNNKENDSLLACYSVTVPAEALKTGENSSLFFLLADANENSNPQPDKKEEKEAASDSLNVNNNNQGAVKNEEENQKAEDKKEEKDKKREAISFSIELADAKGEVIRFKLDDHAFLQPQLEAKMTKLAFMKSTPGSEHLYHFFHFPLEKFLKTNEKFDVSRIVKISLVFDQTEDGVIILDNLGFM